MQLKASVSASYVIAMELSDTLLLVAHWGTVHRKKLENSTALPLGRVHPEGIPTAAPSGSKEKYPLASQLPLRPTRTTSDQLLQYLATPRVIKKILVSNTATKQLAY